MPRYAPRAPTSDHVRSRSMAVVTSAEARSTWRQRWRATRPRERSPTGLAKADPGNAGWQRDLSVSHGKIGDVQRAQVDLAAALASYQASRAIADRSGQGGPRQRRLAARPFGLARQDRRRAAGAGRPGGGAGELPGLARDLRASGEGGPRQRRLAARPLGLARQDRRRAAGAGRPGGGADELPGLARDRRPSGEGGPRQRRLAARPLGLAQQDRRRAAGAGRPGGGADELPGLARNPIFSGVPPNACAASRMPMRRTPSAFSSRTLSTRGR